MDPNMETMMEVQSKVDYDDSCSGDENKMSRWEQSKIQQTAREMCNQFFSVCGTSAAMERYCMPGLGNNPFASYQEVLRPSWINMHLHQLHDNKSSQ